MAAMSFDAQMSYGLGSLGFLVGKIIRLVFFFAYITAIFKHTNSLAGFSLAETALFFLTFNMVDITAMVFFRGVYSARHVVEDGDLDYFLIQPVSPLFRMAIGHVDFLDIATMLPVLVLLGMTWPKLPNTIGPAGILFYLLLILNGIAIALAMHIFVAALAVRTQELENTIWIYRDMMFLGKFPVDIYAAPLKWALILLIPIGVMTTFPAKALLGVLSSRWILYSFGLGMLSLVASLLFWRQALKHYTSVSS
jgi:ABC-2 type transport system permease protein